MARGGINTWNAKIDRSATVRHLGRQGILYEFELPYGADKSKFYEEALNVKSIKRSTRYKNGKRPGQYQPIGDKRYFTYYQMNRMDPNERMAWCLNQYLVSLEESV